MSDLHAKNVHDLKAEIKQLKSSLDKCNAAFYNIINKNRDGILIISQSGKIVYANPAALELFGKDLGELLNENIGIFLDAKERALIKIVHHTRGTVSIELNIAETVWNNEPASLASLRDLTEHEKTKQFLQTLSHIDYLTQLVNRGFFEESLNKALARADRAHHQVSLMLIDLDKFKFVNDTYGHQTGDELLKYVANIFKSTMRAGDVVARIGGDEFAIILEEEDAKNAAERVAKNLFLAIKKPIEMNQHVFSVNFSMGIAIYPDQAKTPEQLIKHADTALYASKSTGGGNYYFFK